MNKRIRNKKAKLWWYQWLYGNSYDWWAKTKYKIHDPQLNKAFKQGYPKFPPKNRDHVGMDWRLIQTEINGRSNQTYKGI